MSDHDAHMSHCNLGDYHGSCKYGEENCPAMSTHPAPELMDFLSKGEAADLVKRGYICISNKYHKIGRQDREDWHVAMAEHMQCAPADFYLRDGSGKLCSRWKEHYIRCHSTDTITTSEATYQYMKKIYQNSLL